MANSFYAISPTPQRLRLRPTKALLSLLALVPLSTADAVAQGTTVMHCNVVGIGGDNANFRGIRFKVDQDFTGVEVQVQGSGAGLFTFDVELRRSDGYIAPIEATASVMVNLNGSPGTTPYQTVPIDFGQVIAVSGLETFTLKALSITGGGAMYWEVAGIGNIPCPDAEVTNENNTATPTMRTSATGFKVVDNSAPTPIGTPYCLANPNSTGGVGQLGAIGSAMVSLNDVTLEVSSLPASSFLYFLVSSTQGQVNNPGGSQGNLCLGGSIGRYVGPGQILISDGAGAASLTIDLTSLPQPGGSVVVMPGQTWNFQAWHRDAVGGVPTSNFTQGLSVMFL
jgi:hypothetical protein